MLSQIPRSVFDAALQWASKATSSPFWSLARPSIKGGVVGTVARNARSDSLGLLADAPEASKSEECVPPMRLLSPLPFDLNRS
jgi:hypothetical protein